ncbi:NAD(+)/NADH kinase [bacterium]|nr:NAD(+)/NADH kinase [bacterium]
MIKSVFILANNKIPDIEKKKAPIEKVLKSCGKVVQTSAKGVDLIISMGGDGTFLKGVKLLQNKTFIYGVKYGNVGFLTNSPSDIENKLRKILSGDYIITKRMLLDVSVVRNNQVVLKDLCLNEAVISKTGIRIIDINVEGKREHIFKTRGDGILVSTPTGSTAHALSAMGPIVDPEVKCFIIIPLCPHTLSWRPVILNEKEVLSISIAQNSLLAIDGQKEFALQDKDTVILKKSSKVANTIMDEQLLFSNLKSKFNWNI